jgi:hypothetical protein
VARADIPDGKCEEIGTSWPCKLRPLAQQSSMFMNEYPAARSPFVERTVAVSKMSYSVYFEQSRELQVLHPIGGVANIVPYPRIAFAGWWEALLNSAAARRVSVGASAAALYTGSKGSAGGPTLYAQLGGASWTRREGWKAANARMCHHRAV